MSEDNNSSMTGMDDSNSGGTSMMGVDDGAPSDGSDDTSSDSADEGTDHIQP